MSARLHPARRVTAAPFATLPILPRSSIEAPFGLPGSKRAAVAAPNAQSNQWDRRAVFAAITARGEPNAQVEDEVRREETIQDLRAR
jgi:hypothetical protein